MWTSPGMVGNCILILTENKEDSLGRPTHKLTGDVDALFLLISTATNTIVKQDIIHDAEEGDDENYAIYDFDGSE